MSHGHTSKSIGAGIALALFLAAAASGATGFASKRYKFSPNQQLTVQLASGPVSIRSVLFEFPSSVMGFRGANRARVKVVNEGEEAIRVGIAISLFDADDRLVGVASGGTKGVRLKPGRETDYSLPFHHLTGHLENAGSFFIAIETGTE